MLSRFNHSTSSKQTVIAAMSGGVDSSLTALLLKEQGYKVIGLFMKNWDEIDESGVCPAEKDYQDVQRVCDTIGIPYYSVNFVKEYKERVFDFFLEELRAGNTPNPDILCNKEIKFKTLLETSLKLGADFLATGHYCQIGKDSNHYQLLRGKDPGKDQSYFLYTIGQDALSKTLFPIGGLLKKDVRRLAANHRLPTAEKQDSTGICFIGERNFKQFLKQYIPYQTGTFQTLTGKSVGQHDGVAYYTIGQRKGLGIGGAGEAWFVVGKDIENNIVFVEQGANHPALFADELRANNPSWVLGAPPSFPLRCTAKIRYRQEDQPCTVYSEDNKSLYVVFDKPQRAITVKQSIVFYDNTICLGGAVIKEAGPSYHAMKKPLSL